MAQKNYSLNDLIAVLLALATGVFFGIFVLCDIKGNYLPASIWVVLAICTGIASFVFLFRSEIDEANPDDF